MLTPGAKANTAAIAQIKAMLRRLALFRRASMLAKTTMPNVAGKSAIQLSTPGRAAWNPKRA